MKYSMKYRILFEDGTAKTCDASTNVGYEINRYIQDGFANETGEMNFKIEFIKENKEPKLDILLSQPMKHIDDIIGAFEECLSEDDVNRVLEVIPKGFGDFTITWMPEGFEIFNVYFDRANGEYEEETWYIDYPDEWEA